MIPEQAVRIACGRIYGNEHILNKLDYRNFFSCDLMSGKLRKRIRTHVFN